MFSRRFILGAIPAVLLSRHTRADATVYFSTDTVKAQMFGLANRFVDRSFDLTRAQSSAIRAASRARVNSNRITAFDAYRANQKLGTLVIDRVYGKHEFITYAVAISAGGAVTGVEIMDYRESYGDQVRNERWRAQFTGRRAGQPLSINNEIRNISGATLSCVHITDGVRRVLATYSQLLA